MNATRSRPWRASVGRLRRSTLRHRHRRAWLSHMAPRLVAAAVPGASSGAWRTESVAISDTLVVMAVVACASTARRVLIKVPSTVEGVENLRRQADTLAALHADRRLDGWLRLVPRTLAYAEADGHRYWVEEALPGTPVTAPILRHPRDRAVLDAAVRLIDEFHARTSQRRAIDDATVRRWVERPLCRLERRLAGLADRDRYADTLDRIRAELLDALTGRTTRTCWIHGDFWPGNLLAAGTVVTGVVDWDQAGARQLPLHDLLHMHLFARRLTTGAELGDLVVDAVHRGLAGTLGVPAGRVTGWLHGIPDRPAALLYWLRHVSLFIDSEGHGDNPRWLRGNVERVLARV